MSRAAMRWVTVVALLVTALIPGAAHSQVGTPRGGPGDRAQLEARVRAQMARVMRERLGLTEDQGAQLAEITDRFDGRRRELLALEQATRRRVEAVLLEGGSDQSEARDLISRMGDLREQEARLFRDEQEALLAVLTPVQVLRLQDLRQDLGQRIRALRGSGDPQGNPRLPGPARGGRGGRGPGGRGVPPVGQSNR